MKNIKFYISYFYQLRFFPVDVLPISTCMWDPKWFHNNLSQDNTFIDSRGVVNGVRLDELTPKEIHEIGQIYCHKDCDEDIPCVFMKAYYDYLCSLNFESIVKKCVNLYEKYGFKTNEDTAQIILLVNEPSHVKCAERPCLIKWFKQNGYLVEEWSKDFLKLKSYNNFYKQFLNI